MWLDRLPRKTDVVCQFIFAKETQMAVADTLTMTANAVKYIWDEADVPCVSVDEILTAIYDLFEEVHFQATGQTKVSKHLLPGRIYNLATSLPLSCGDNGKLGSNCKSFNSLQDILESERMLALFDVSVAEMVGRHSFYHDQKTHRKLKNKKRLGQISMRGSDVYYENRGSGPGAMSITEHSVFPARDLPTRLDVLEFVKSRTTLR